MAVLVRVTKGFSSQVTLLQHRAEDELGWQEFGGFELSRIAVAPVLHLPTYSSADKSGVARDIPKYSWLNDVGRKACEKPPV